MVLPRHQIDVQATVLLLFSVTVAVIANGCSSRPDIINCTLVEKNELPNQTNETFVNWMGTKPFGLRIMYLVKTSTSGDSLNPISMVRWRIQLSRAHLSQPIHGFLIKIDDFEGESRIFEAALEQPVQEAENNLTKISLLPLGEYGSSSQIIQLPELPKEKSCIDDKKTTDLAKYWIGKLDIFTLDEISAVNITMMTAPEFLCIKAYMIQITGKNAHVLYHRVVNKVGDFLSHLVEFLPRDVELIVKVTPSGDVCPCPACNCFISKSLPFVIPTMEEKVYPTKTLDFSYTDDDSANLRKFVIFAVIVVILFLAFLIVFCAVKNMKKYKRLPDVGYPQVYESKAYTILLAAASSTKEEYNVIDEFALLLHNSKHLLLYDRFDETSELNIHKWLHKATKKADKIIMVHSIGTNYNAEYFNCFNWIQDNTPTYNDKMIYVKLHEKAVIKNSFVETVFLLSRDCAIFCKQMGMQYSQQWTALQDRCGHLYNKESTAVRIKDLGDPAPLNLAPIPASLPPILVPQGTQDTVGDFLSHLVEFLPRDVELIVKVTPSGDVCPCPACNCFISKSLPFVIPTMEEKVYPTKTLDFSYTDDDSANLRKFVIFAVIVVILFLAFLIVFCAVKNMKEYKRLPDVGYPQVYESKAYTILLAAAPSTKEEYNVIDEFALLLHNSKHLLLYDRFDETSELNIHKWLHKATKKAYKIVMVHSIGGNYNAEYFNCFNWIQDNTPTYNDKMIYVKLHEKAVIKNSFVETVFLLSRDCAILCKQMGMQYSQQWTALQDRCGHLYNKESTAVRIKDLGDPAPLNLAPIPASVPPILVPQGTQDTVIYTACNDSGYGDSL